jgi:ribose transport system permease protein
MKLKTMDKTRTGLFHNNTFIGLALIAAMFLIGLTLNHNFLSAKSIGNIFTNASLLAFASLGQTLVVISGGVDLSIASCISFGAVGSALIMKGDNANLPQAILVLVLTGVLVGFINAAGIIYAKIPPLVMTLAVSNVLNVIQLIVCNGSPTGSPAPAIKFLGKYKVTTSLSLITLLLFVVAILVYFGLKHNGYAKQLYAVGNNRNAATLVGINANKVIMLTYIISAVLASLTGMLLLGYVNFPYINMGASYGMLTVAAVVIGGASFVGGKGHFTGTIIGALVLINLSNILVAIQLNDAVKNVINGLVLLAILVFYTREKAIRQ